MFLKYLKSEYIRTKIHLKMSTNPTIHLNLNFIINIFIITIVLILPGSLVFIYILNLYFNECYISLNYMYILLFITYDSNIH